MKALSIIFLCVLLTLGAQAQFGINAKYTIPADDSWPYTAESGNGIFSAPYTRGWSVGLDYWFRLKNKRVEFLPEINLMQLSHAEIDIANHANIYSFFFNTNFYFWDFNGDCDCPTFSKQGPTLEKGLFIQVSPGVSLWDVEFGEQFARIDDQQMVFSIGAGGGFDIGITDLLTLTPMATVRYFPEVKMEGALLDPSNPNSWPVPNSSIVSTESPLLWSVGLRLGFRLDGSRY